MLARWFQPNYQGWNPRLYEWWFTTNPVTASIRAREEKVVYSALEPSLSPRSSLIEVGPGSGNYTLPLAQRCKEIVAADCSDEMLGYLERRLRARKLTNVELRSNRLPEPIEHWRRFDAALSVGVFNYVDDLEACLRSVAACLKPSARLVFTVPFQSAEGRAYALSEGLLRRRVWLRSRSEAIAAAMRAGFSSVSTQTAGFTRTGLTLVVSALLDGARLADGEARPQSTQTSPSLTFA